MVEYTKEFIEKIMVSMGDHDSCTFIYMKEKLESLLPVELPPCPVCGGKMLVSQLDGYFRWWCHERACIASGLYKYKTKQEAIDAYLAIPYCILYLDYAMSAE